MREVRFLIDADTNEPHIFRHGVSCEEVLEVFRSYPERLRAKLGATQSIGQTHAGRYLKVIYDEDDFGLLVITAYDLGPKALRAYRRRRRRRQ